MKINKIFSSILLVIFVLFVTKPVYAQESTEESDYKYVTPGYCVTKSGFFFSNEGMANLYLLIDEKIKLAVLEKQKELDLLKIDLEKCTKSKEVELNIQKEMYERQLIIKQKAIDAYKNQLFWNNVLTASGVLVAFGAGVLIANFINK